MVLLSVESDNGTVLTYRLNKTQITVGSSSRNDVVVRSPGVADRHLVVHRANGQFTFVTAERQTVMLNGEKRSRGVLNPGDKVRLGAMTLVFRGTEGETVEATDALAEPAARRAAPAGDGSVVYRSDPAGFVEARSGLGELLTERGSDVLEGAIGLLRDALPDAELAIAAPAEDGALTLLASEWSGDVPRVPRDVLDDIAVAGRYAAVDEDEGGFAVVPIIDRHRDVPAVLLARPVGALGDEGVALLAEYARVLSLHWDDVEREDESFSGWELEARHRLQAQLPGSSQAIQALRSGLVTLAHGSEPVLVCGAAGTGRTEVARILASLGPVAGRPVVVFEGRDADPDALRQELFGASRRAAVGPEVSGAVGRARGGILIVRNLDALPLPIQTELAGVIGAQSREQGGGVRWLASCGEDPLGAVQQGRLSSQLFMLFAPRMLRVPRLEERREDLPILIATLLQRAAAEQGKKLRGITLDCLNILLARHFPAEMSDLIAEISRLVTATPEGEMVRCEAHDVAGRGEAASPSDLPPELLHVLSSNNLKDTIPRVEQLLIDRVMRQVKGNQSKGSRMLGISRGALITKLKEYGIPDYRYLRRRKAGGL
jgi:two-component system response regulator AtoC